MLNLTFMDLCASLARVFAVLLVAAAVRAEQPLGMILEDSDGQVLRPGRNSPLNARTGVEIFARDLLVAGHTPLKFAYCPSKQAVNLPRQKSFQINADRMASANLRMIANSQPLTVCELPAMTPLPQAPTVPRRAPRPRSQPDLRVAQIDRELPQQGEAPSVLIRVARAVRLDKAGLSEEAIMEYDGIHSAWPDAKWTEEVSGRTAAVTDSGRGTELPASVDWLPKKTYAVLIGISKYGTKAQIPSLNYAAADAELFEKYQETDRGGKLRKCDDKMKDCEILLIENKDATLARVGDVFDDKPQSFVASHSKRENQLVIFVAAHGLGPAAESANDNSVPNSKGKPVPNPEPVIVTYDADDELLNTTALPMQQLRQDAVIAAKSYGRVLVFVDVCRAGYVGTVQESPAMHDAVRTTFELNDRTGLFMASDQKHNAFEFKEMGGGHGVFTYFAVAGMSHPPSTGTLSFGDLADEISRQVKTATKNCQFPTSDAADQSLTVVDDLSKPAITLLPPNPVAVDCKARGRGPMPSAKRSPPEPAPVDDPDPLRAGRLRRDESKSAWAEWERLKKSGSSNDTADAYANRLRIALEDRGQQVVLKYLRGDQEAMKEAEFIEGARDFEAALEN